MKEVNFLLLSRDSRSKNILYNLSQEVLDRLDISSLGNTSQLPTNLFVGS